ncbi:MAG: 23S rRNA (guanosine(2251)-2'-O)-methyltransferase RlmB [Alphaproteobacteria bacterium]
MKFKKNNQNKPRLYGMHAVREAWLNPERTIYSLYLTEQAHKSFEEVFLLARKKGLRRNDPIIVDKAKLEKMLPRGAVHQGIALACSTLEESDIQDFIIRATTQPKTVLAILDQVTDPHNVGAILRSASAFGLDGVLMQKKHAPSLDGVLAKTACGAVDHIDVAPVTNLSRTIRELQGEGFFVIGLDERGQYDIGKIKTMRAHHESTKIAVVLGSEGDGIRRLVKEACDDLVRLPTEGAIASLNVSNAAAVSFYALSNE